MGGANVGTDAQRLAADNSQHDALTMDMAVNAVTSLQLHTRLQRLESMLLSLSDSPGSCFPLSLAGIDKCSITLAIFFHFPALLRSQTGKTVLGCSQQGFTQFVSSHM